MNLITLTTIASYYADDIDPDAVDPSSQPRTTAAPPAPLRATASLTSNLFLRYFPPRPAAATAGVEWAPLVDGTRPTAPEQPKDSSSLPSSSHEGEVGGGSLVRAAPLAFSAAHPLARLAVESSPAGYRSSGIVIWHRPLCATPMFLSRVLLRTRTGGGKSRPCGLWSPPARTVDDDARDVSGDASTDSDGSSESSSSVSSLTEAQRVVPPAPLFFSRAMLYKSAAATAAAAASTCDSTYSARGCNQGVDRIENPSPALPPPAAASTLPTMSKVVVLLHLYDREQGEEVKEGEDVAGLYRRQMQKRGRIRIHAGGAGAADDANSVWRMMGPVLWWLERSVQPVTDVPVVAGTDARTRPSAHAAEESRAEADTPLSLSLCHSFSSSSVTAAPPPTLPRLPCAIRLFLSPWAMPRRRRCITVSSKRITGSTCSPSRPSMTSPLWPPCRWCPHALVELGLCGPNSDSPDLFSAATFLATLAVNVNQPPTEHDSGGSSAERRLRRHRLGCLRYRGSSSSAIPAFGPFPTPCVSSGSQWSGGGGGRRGIATWRTPACATLPVSKHPQTSRAIPPAATRHNEEERWVQRPLLELLGLEGVWGDGGRVTQAANEAEVEEERGGERATVTQQQLLLLSPPLRSALPPPLATPLLPLHTLDLSFRWDLRQLETVLARWAATGHLSRLSRLSVMGCVQLRDLDWLAEMPADTLEELNISGCAELRDVHRVRRLSALRILKAAQLAQLERLGWWWGWEGETVDEQRPSTDGRASLPCQLHRLAELDLACTRRRKNCLADVEWLGALPSLRKLATSVSEPDDSMWHPPMRSVTASFDVARLAWLVGCAELRDLHLAFRDGPRAAAAPRGGQTQLSSPPPPLFFSSFAAAAAHVGHGDALPPPPSDLRVLSLSPFPHLRVLELAKATLAEDFTSWLAVGCPQLREIHLISCTVRCTTAGLRQAQARYRLALPAHMRLTATATTAVSRTRASPSFQPLPPAEQPGRVNTALGTGRHTATATRGLIRRDHLTPHHPVSGVVDNVNDDDDDVQQRRKEEQWWWGQLCHLRRLRRLSVYDLEGLTSGSSLDWVVGCGALRDLALRKCRWLLDAYAVHRLPRLRTLNLNATGIDDLTFLRMREGVMVRAPPLASTTAAHTSSPARGPLTPASSSSPSPVAALSPVVAAQRSYPRQLQQKQQQQQQQQLSKAPSPSSPFPASPPLLPPPPRPPALSYLSEVVLVDCPFLSDLSPIAYLTSCRSLFASDHPVHSLDHLSTCVSLEKLYLINYVKLTDISALRWLRRLRTVYITHSSVRDLSWVAQTVTPLMVRRWRRALQQGASAAAAASAGAAAHVRNNDSSSSSSDGDDDYDADAHDDDTGSGVWCSPSLSAAAARVHVDEHHHHTSPPPQHQQQQQGGRESKDSRFRGRGSRGKWCVLPQLEVLTLAYSKFLTDVSALGALPRLRHLDLRDCVHLSQLGSVKRANSRTATVGTTATTAGTAAMNTASGRPATRVSAGVFSPPNVRAPQLHRNSMADGGKPSGSLREWSLRWVGQAAVHAMVQLRRWRTTAVSGWAAHRETPPPKGGAADVTELLAHTQQHQTTPSAVTAAVSSGGKASGGTGPSIPPPLTAMSLAHLAPTLRYVSLSGCKALVDATPLGELHQLQYLHAAFTGIRDVRWVRGCTSLKVLDLTMSPCCTSSASAVTFLARLPDELAELEIVNSRPVEDIR
jgi:hypothetical protein